MVDEKRNQQEEPKYELNISLYFHHAENAAPSDRSNTKCLQSNMHTPTHISLSLGLMSVPKSLDSALWLALHL